MVFCLKMGCFGLQAAVSYKILKSQNYHTSTGLGFFHRGGCPNGRSHRSLRHMGLTVQRRHRPEILSHYYEFA
jgi:hypothetical protein